MKKTIIVIDDEESVRKTLGRLLEREGYDIILSHDGRDALDKLSRHIVDVILLDMNMPNMNGIDFLKHIRKHNITRAPVLMASGSSDPAQRAESYKLGVYDYIKKPEQTEVLLKRIENGIKIGEMIHFNDFIKIELIMAKKLQKYLYPEPFLIDGNFEMRAWTYPLSEVGGDLFDYIKFRDGRIIFFVADVSGHSISAALYTAIVKMIFRNAIKIMDTPGKVLAMVNRELTGNIPVESFVTMFAGLYNPESSILYYSNAGHPAPYLKSEGSISELEGNDSFLGPIPDAGFRTFERVMKRGEKLFIYTDGVIDVMGEKKKPLGREVLTSHISKDGLSLSGMIEGIRDEILLSENLYRTDDCTLMFVGF